MEQTINNTMTEVKLIEIRDRGTFIPAIAIRVEPYPEPYPGTTQLMTSTKDLIAEAESYLLRRAGYSSGLPCVLFTRLDCDGPINFESYDWGDRTYQTIHNHLEMNWGLVISGDVLDVEFLLKETTEPKVSERHG